MKTVKFDWTYNYKSSFRGSVTPVFDPLTNSILISDGWGSYYSGMRLRRLLIGSGQEDTSAVVRDSVCSIIFSENKESLFIALQKRILEVNRSNLEIVNSWKNHIPRNSFFISQWENNLLCMNWGGPSLSIYDLDTSDVSRKRLGSCMGVFRLSRDTFIVASGMEGFIWKISMGDNSAEKWLSLPQFHSAVFDSQSSRLITPQGKHHTATEQSIKFHEPNRLLTIVDFSNNGKTDIYESPKDYSFLAYDHIRDLIILMNGSELYSCRVDSGKLSIIEGWKVDRNYEIVSYIPELDAAVSVCNVERESTLALAYLNKPV